MKWNFSLHEIFSNIQYKCTEVLISHISKSTPPISAASSFLNLQVRFNKMVNEHTVDYPPSPPEFTSRINHLIFYGLLRGLYLENIEYFLNFFLIPVYLTMVAKKFQIDGVKITGKYICESKHWICLLMPPRKTLH